jgi:hypothetical protein
MNGPKDHISEELLRELYEYRGMSMELIANSLGFKSASSIKTRLDKFGIKSRSPGEGLRSVFLKGHRKPISGSQHPSWNGGEYTTTKGYLKVSRPNHPRATTTGYVLKHILVWEEEHNRSLPSNFVVHHINGVKNDNRPENLLALKQQKHHWAIVLNETRKRVQELETENRRLIHEQTGH